VSCVIIVDCNITEDSSRVWCPSHPYSWRGIGTNGKEKERTDKEEEEEEIKKRRIDE